VAGRFPSGRHEREAGRTPSFLALAQPGEVLFDDVPGDAVALQFADVLLRDLNVLARNQRQQRSLVVVTLRLRRGQPLPQFVELLPERLDAYLGVRDLAVGRVRFVRGQHGYASFSRNSEYQIAPTPASAGSSRADGVAEIAGLGGLARVRRVDRHELRQSPP